MRMLSQALSWLVTLVVIRLLTPADYGLLAMAQILIGLATLLNEIGLTPALIQMREAPERTIASVHGYVLLSNAVLYALVYAVAPAFARFYGQDDLIPVVRVLGLQLVIGALGAVPFALAKRNLAFKSISLVNLAAALAGSLASLVVARADGGVWALVTATLVMAVGQSLGMIVTSRFKIAPSLEIAGMRRLLSFGAWISGSRLAWFFASSADDLIIGKCFDSHVLGHFNVAKNLASIPMSRVMEIINQVMFPLFSRLEGNAERAMAYFSKSVWMGMLIFCPLTWGLSSVADVFTEVVLGPAWLDAAFALRVIALSIPIQAVSFLLTPVTDALGRPDIGFRNSMIRLVVFPLSVVVAIPWGLDGICITFVLGRMLTLVMYLHVAARHFPLSLTGLCRASAPPVIAGVVMYLAVALLLHFAAGLLSPLALLIVGTACGALVYAGALLVLAPRTVAELRASFATR